MDLASLIARDALLPALKVSSKKQALSEIANRAAEAYGLPARSAAKGSSLANRIKTTPMIASTVA